LYFVFAFGKFVSVLDGGAFQDVGVCFVCGAPKAAQGGDFGIIRGALMVQLPSGGDEMHKCVTEVGADCVGEVVECVVVLFGSEFWEYSINSGGWKGV